MTLAKRHAERAAPFHFFDLKPDKSNFAKDVVGGLSQEPKSLPPKYFYDLKGSQLFNRICDTAEYYVTRTERKLLQDIAPQLAALAGPGATVIEYGSGACMKVRTLLDALDAPAGYVAIDISQGQLLGAAASIADDFPGLEVTALCADFAAAFALPADLPLGSGIKLGFFPGSTIGNMTPAEALGFLAGARALLAPDGALVVGVDLKKDAAVLNLAYNDAEGVTAAFNKNILERMKRELGAAVDVDAFEHVAFFNDAESRIEMHLRARRDTTIAVGERRFELAQGETIHTENSYKHDVRAFGAMAETAGFDIRGAWTAADQPFAVLFLAASG